MRRSRDIRAFFCLRAALALALCAFLPWAHPTYAANDGHGCAAEFRELSPGFHAFSPTLGLDQLQAGIAAHRARVPEFDFIKKEAERRGLRVWLFGGTAAGYAHYVNWDLLREAGASRFQKNRFDYDYTNIFRSTQDLDIVVDGNSQQASEFQNALKEKFPYFLGSKANQWEVRSLTDARQDKGALLDDFGFMNQHTDSNSTGMVELTDPPKGVAQGMAQGEPVVRDLRTWKSTAPSQFLKDVHEGKITYYHSPTHGQTARAQSGQNPPIFSVVRYLTKAFQYELKMRDEDLAVIKKEIAGFDPKRDLASADAQRWIEKNGKKLFQHAVNIEYAWDLLENLGLRKKLISIKDNPGEKDSLAWWLNKEPLRSHPVGGDLADTRSAGKTARELGLEIVAHETNDFLAYESITRAHTGSPNVLISRQNAVGELAAHGNGFYTAVGKKGGRGTKITIRFEVNPDAREGRDFILAGDPHHEGSYIVFRNKNALRVIPDSLEMSPLQFFEFLASGKEIPQDDEALLWKLKRRLQNSLTSGLTSPEELKNIRLLVRDQMRSKAPNHDVVFQEWLKLEGARPALQMDADELAEMIKSGAFRADPVPFVAGLQKITRGTELEDWLSHEYLPGLMTALRPDIGDRAIENSLLSENPEIVKFGLRALTEASHKRPSAFLRALSRIVDTRNPNELDTKNAIGRWLGSHRPGESSEELEEKAAFISMQTGKRGTSPNPTEWLSRIPENERDEVGKILAQKTLLPLFEGLARGHGTQGKKEEELLLSHASAESFQFVNFDIPKTGKKFTLGSPESESGRFSDEELREGTLAQSFEMQMTPLTEFQKALLLGEDISELNELGNRPAGNVSWDDAKGLIDRLNALDPHHTYRLPHEVEWEYAARAGTGTTFSFGDDAKDLSDYAIHTGNSGHHANEVATRKPNPAGLHDMHGNVWEWCEDWYDDSVRVIRGGRWNSGAQNLRSARRGRIQPGYRDLGVGLRLVRTSK